MIFKGSGVALVTPFDEQDKVNYEIFKDIIDMHLSNQTDALIICGTTGEAATLTEEEKIQLINFTVSYVSKKIPVIVGVGTNSTSTTIKLSNIAQNLNANGLLIVTPYYNKTTQKGLIEHYKIIANNTNLPIILYNVPSRTGLNMLPATVKELSYIKNIIGIKEASGDISQVMHIKSICNDDFSIYSGNDDQILPMLALGAHGVISTCANIIPREVSQINKLFFESRLDECLKLQLSIIHLIHSLFSEVNPIPIKAAMNLLGLNTGKCRGPLTDMEHSNLKKLKESMEGLKLFARGHI
jgi:4-hydroxy-tetrahydrodipicolinate synthase